MRNLFLETEKSMKAAVEHFHQQLKQLRAGRASIAIFEGVTADYYGIATPLNQLANLSVADPTLIVAQPYDASQIGAIEKAIRVADLGLNPSNDGRLIRIPIPPLTEERRKELVRKAHDVAEQSRNAIRGIRRDGNDQIKNLERNKEIGQDEEHDGYEEVQKLHDHYILAINTSLENKEKDIMEV